LAFVNAIWNILVPQKHEFLDKQIICKCFNKGLASWHCIISKHFPYFPLATNRSVMHLAPTQFGSPSVFAWVYTVTMLRPEYSPPFYNLSLAVKQLLTSHSINFLLFLFVVSSRKTFLMILLTTKPKGTCGD
jgi:hypothetical protein